MEQFSGIRSKISLTYNYKIPILSSHESKFLSKILRAIGERSILSDMSHILQGSQSRKNKNWSNDLAEEEFEEARILEIIRSILCEVTGHKDIVISKSSSSRDVPGWDSIAHIALILAVERQFFFRMRASEIAQLTNVGSLIDLIIVRAKRES